MIGRPGENKLKVSRNRRSGVDRRQFVYSSYIPERRSGRERRALSDRRMTDRGAMHEEIKNL